MSSTWCRPAGRSAQTVSWRRSWSWRSPRASSPAATLIEPEHRGSARSPRGSRRRYMPLYRVDSPETETALREIERRRAASVVDALRVADEAIAGVRARGDDFVREQVARFDGVAVDALRIAPRDVNIDPLLAGSI